MSTDRIWHVTGAVVLAHIGVGWAISSSLLTPVVPMGARDTVIMASVVMDAPAPPAPMRPKPEASAKPPTLKPKPLVTAQAQPKPISTQFAPSDSAPVVPAATASPAVATSAPAATGSQHPSAQSHTAPTAKMVQPSINADYIHNPAPPYPRISKRLGEQGTVIIRVFINTEGRAEQAEIRSSSGYTRLDDTALATVKSWRFVPGQRNGVAEAMWFNVPIRFVLD